MSKVDKALFYGVKGHKRLGTSVPTSYLASTLIVRIQIFQTKSQSADSPQCHSKAKLLKLRDNCHHDIDKWIKDLEKFWTDAQMSGLQIVWLKQLHPTYSNNDTVTVVLLLFWQGIASVRNKHQYCTVACNVIWDSWYTAAFPKVDW